MTVLLPNNATTTLTAAIDTSSTAIVVTDGSVFPVPSASQYFYATLASAEGVLEIVKVVNRSSNILTVERGKEGTVPSIFAAGS